MEVDHLTYIFGSFTRRPQSEEHSVAKRRSLEPSASGAGNGPLHESPARSVAYGTRAVSFIGGLSIPSIDDSEDAFVCGVCKRRYAEPRLLPCLHSFCTQCLLNLYSKGSDMSLWSQDNNGSNASLNKTVDASGSRPGSAASGYESEQRHTSGSDASWNSDQMRSPKKIGIYTSRQSGTRMESVVCPTCLLESRLPPGGVRGLPHNFVLQHRMLVAALNRDHSGVLCDLCTTDIPATHRCSTCLISMCSVCCDAHSRQRITSVHEVGRLGEVKGGAGAAWGGITRLRRQVMCSEHRDSELKIFCKTCSQVICRDCCLISHQGHSFSGARAAAEAWSARVRDATERVRPVSRHATIARDRMQALQKRIQIKTEAVDTEIDMFIDNYIRSVEDHRHTLKAQLQKGLDTKLAAIISQNIRLEQRTEHANEAVIFAEEVLAEGTDVEILSLARPLLSRLEWCSDLESLLEPRVSDNLRLLREEKAVMVPDVDQVPLYGLIATQSVAPHMCTLDTLALAELRVHREHEVVLELRDSDGLPLCGCGDARVEGCVRRGPGAAARGVRVRDRKDGTYAIVFVPDEEGQFQLAVMVNDQPIKGSPFRLVARSVQPHTGKYHCCTFCSTGGDRAATCGCGASMGAHYQGCGHGHAGHPGGRHWSCCGNIKQNSECFPNSSDSPVYQFTL